VTGDDCCFPNLICIRKFDIEIEKEELLLLFFLWEKKQEKSPR